LLLNRQQHFDLYAHSARRAPLGQRRRLDLASQLAETQGNAQAIVASELGIAKVFHRITDDEPNKLDFKTAKSMQDLGRMLLQSVGLREPDDVSIQAAIEANDAFIAALEAIRDKAQALMIES
jgi:hypothetical protein